MSEGNTVITLDDDEQFFWDNAMYSWRKAEGETEHHGHAVAAILLANAERNAKRHGWEIRWAVESFPDRSEGYCGPVWAASLYNEDGDFKTSLSGIELDTNAPEDSDQGRVVFAELALEANA